MEETVEIIMVSALLVTLVTVASWIIGSIGCALAGIRPGFFARVGLGLLGVVAFGLVSAIYKVHVPVWLTWVGSAACVTGMVALVRAFRSSRSRRKAADAPPPAA